VGARRMPLWQEVRVEVRTDADRVLEQAVESGAVAGVVAVAANDQGVVYEGAFGKRAAGGPAPMTMDTVFWIASMTKAITSVAALQQVEHGRLSLDEPLGSILKELGDVKVLEGFDAKGKPRLRAAKRPVTLRLLLTHTAGFTYDIWNAEIGRYMEHAKVPGIIECKNATLGIPLAFEPGERWEYGINIDWVGKAVESVSGRSLEDYFKAYIFEPLGMRDSGFLIGPDQRPRLATMHARLPDGSLAPIEFELTQSPEFFMGGGGLYSTATDYLTFLRALLNKGTLDGVRILSPDTVAEMNRNHIGDLNVTKLVSVIPQSSNDAEFFPGMVKKWGLAYMTSTEAAPTGRSANSLAWAGLGNTYFWLDPEARLAGVFCTQILPFADPQALELFAAWETAVYEKAG
jgi:methyl acetate hydrolase